MADLASRTGESNRVVLGRYFENSASSYEQVAIRTGSTYYSMPSELYTRLGETLGKNFRWLCNQRFLEKYGNMGYTFNFSSNPDTSLYLKGSPYYLELTFIEDAYLLQWGEWITQ